MSTLLTVLPGAQCEWKDGTSELYVTVSGGRFRVVSWPQRGGPLTWRQVREIVRRLRFSAVTLEVLGE